MGGGISGLAALHYLKTKSPDSDVTLYESSDRPGGVIGTDIVGGYVCEWGASGILDRNGLCRQLCEELGIEDSLESAAKAAKNRYVLRENKLCPVPLSPATFLFSKILTPKGKFRLLCEPFTSPTNAADESIYDFFIRHIGREATDYIIQPMVTGIFAGRAEQLSLQACFPKLHELDRKYGSLLKGVIKSQFHKRKSDQKAPKRKGSMRLLSFKQKGVSVLVEALAERHKTNIRTGMPVVGIKKSRPPASSNDKWSISLINGSNDEADNIILAVPAYQASSITLSHSERLSGLFKLISYAPLVVVCLGYSLSAATRPLDGFGFLVPPKENKKILGSIWISSVYNCRAPDQKFHLRVMLGGSGVANMKLLSLSDEQLLNIVRVDLKDIMGIEVPPEMVKIYRHERAIPEYNLGHPKLLTQIETELAGTPGLYLAGNYYSGVGVSDCLKTSLAAVDKILS